METLSPVDRKREIAARFDLRADTYDRNRAQRACAQRLLELAELQPGERVLDVACGTGNISLPATKAVGPQGRVVGVDLAEGMIAQARRKAQQMGLANIDLRVGDAEHLDLENGLFDAVLCGLGVLFFPDQPAAAREWHRLLRPGGRVVFSAWRQRFGGATREQLDARLAALGLRAPSITSPHTQDPEACRSLLEQAGFEDVEVLTEQHGFFYASAEEYWEEDVVSSIMGTLLARLEAQDLARLREEHLAEVAATATPQGIWREGAVNFARGRKPAGVRQGTSDSPEYGRKHGHVLR